MAKPADLLQGTLDFLVLKAISREADHGWGIAKRIQFPVSGVLTSLYPALRRLEQQGWIGQSKDTLPGCQAKCYVLTAEGRRQLEGWSNPSSRELVEQSA